MRDHISRPTPAEAAQRYYQEHLIMISEFGDLAARAVAIGDTFGSSRYQRHADEHMKAAWKALVHWRECLEQQRGGRSCA
ncbi:hypothetical protein [Microvirga makkahensis]|uniref:Uncharacterized protein n=1 Tax=Microvirga makkahensis TaxID=1128670 RepID=A0A7X3MU21_9HYPH|nr:hypothetical protein [Microvirga makkahensis]MXQ13229.1 hypothetical protein [Microvirga makkahensis]